MKYPIKFMIASNGYKSVKIHSQDFPKEINKDLIYCNKTNSFSTILELPEGIFNYQFDADGTIIDDMLRSPLGGISTLSIGTKENHGIIFNLEKSFIKNNHLVLVIGLDLSEWNKATLMIQTLNGITSIIGKSTFFEGSCDYQMFVINLPKDETLLAYFELENHHEISFYYGQNGLHQQEWAVEPFEVNLKIQTPIKPSDLVAIYHIPCPKIANEFEKHITYFEKFPIDQISGAIPPESLLLKQFTFTDSHHNFPSLTALLRDILLETEDFNPSLGLLGRFAYEYRQDIANIPFSLSTNNISFWDLVKRNVKTATRGIGLQLLGSMTPEILFGEEIGLYKTGVDRKMFWTKTKWNKELYQTYQKFLKLRKKYPVLRQGRFRFVVQDCSLWGIERYMDGEDSIYIFANHSKNNIIIDLAKIMNFSGPILDILPDHPLKRTKVCTIFGESLVLFKQNSSKNKKTTLVPKDDK